ncbi:MAG TPA: hypothetical protein ENN90_11860 [Mariniphaga anaerophila]|uniref:Uncharacterized protein n=1 Tax=Mariniphaga anaerophila TaxID=1484053 RepID=A0A831PRT4_9BACT|nr:hypothetical protein [Mariniphaga anaerophila]
MQRKKRKPLDLPVIGFLAGFLVPVLVFFGVFWFGEKGVSFKNYVKNLWHLQALVKLGSLCVFTNLLVFMGFIRLKYDQSARGVLGATILYALAVLISRAF